MNSSPNLIYDSEKSFYSNNVTQIMDSNSNIFFSSSPLFRQILNHSKTNSRNNHNNINNTSSNKSNKIFKKLKDLKSIKKKFFSLSTDIKDREKLTSYYKISIENQYPKKKNRR